MLTSLRNALKIKDIRDRLFFTFLMLMVVRFGSNLPIPGVNTEYLKNFFEQQRQSTGNASFHYHGTDDYRDPEAGGTPA